MNHFHVAVKHMYSDSGDAVRKEMTYEEAGKAETIGYDFHCEGTENNLDQCKGQRVVCYDKIVVECKKPGLSGE